MTGITFMGIIPTRYGSTRLPGKPLEKIGGMSVIEHVYRRVSEVLDTVMVATDDMRIYDHVLSFGGVPVLTRNDHRCGTERCLEAYLHYKTKHPYDQILSEYHRDAKSICANEDVVINIQGDEPFVSSEQIRAIERCFTSPHVTDTQIATLICPFSERDTWEDLSDPNTVKAVPVFKYPDSAMADVLTFSRSVIPFLRDIPQNEWTSQGLHYKHLGMYAYRVSTLFDIVHLPESSLEKAEKLEQLRWLENGLTVRATVTEHYTKGIDTPDDLRRARNEWENSK